MIPTHPIPLAALVVAASASLLPAQDVPDFATAVWPILEQRCVECHGAPRKDARGRLREPKAGLRLDGRGWIEAGSDLDEVLIPGDADGSMLYEFVALPADDPLIMPAKGDPLSAEQIETIRAWIAGGADFGDWVGSGGPEDGGDAAAPKTEAPVVLPPRVRLLQDLAEGLNPLGAKALERAAGEKARIAPALPGSPLLSVSFVGSEGSVTKADLEALEPLAGHITELDLGDTALGDAALRVVRRMGRLTRLDLHRTKVTDRGLASLRDCEKLRSLVLWGTGVGDRGLVELAQLGNLENLYLWQTRCTSKGVTDLRQRLPGCRIVDQRVLPSGGR